MTASDALLGWLLVNAAILVVIVGAAFALCAFAMAHGEREERRTQTPATHRWTAPANPPVVDELARRRARRTARAS